LQRKAKLPTKPEQPSYGNQEVARGAIQGPAGNKTQSVFNRNEKNARAHLEALSDSRKSIEQQ